MSVVQMKKCCSSLNSTQTVQLVLTPLTGVNVTRGAFYHPHNEASFVACSSFFGTQLGITEVIGGGFAVSLAALEFHCLRVSIISAKWLPVETDDESAIHSCQLSQ